MKENGIDQVLVESLFKKMFFIRSVEEALLELFSMGKIFGTTHTSIGQEAIAVASMAHIQDGDVVFSNHRCHGHYLAYGGSAQKLFSEIMGKEDGVCGGRGGSQHICYNNFYTNGIQGGIVGNAAGAALAHKLKKNNNMAVVFLGDGTLGEGLVYETFNLASLWSLPILFIVENNKYAQSTPIHLGVSGKIIDRPKSFGIDADHTDSKDTLVLHELFKERFNYVRSNQRPFCQIIDTNRFAPHSKGDDYRDPAEIAGYKENDPIIIMGNRLPQDIVVTIERQVHEEIQQAINQASESDYIDVSGVELDASLSNFYGIETNINSKNAINNILNDNDNLRVNESLNKALHNMMEENNDIVVIGEDILDPYGGAFKVTKGLSTRFPDRVLTTPISEAGIVSLATGLAMQGKRPIVEIMFGDFLALAADQLLNHASKYQWMYNNQVQVPLVVRTPMGGKRGYGPTHSQSIEKMFMGIPGLTVVSPTSLHDPGSMLTNSVLNHNGPVLFVENKVMYGEYMPKITDGRFDQFWLRSTDTLFPTLHLSLDNFGPADITIITYGGNLPIALEVSKTLMIEEEILVDIVAPSLLSPLPVDEIAQFIGASKTVVVIEEGTSRHGWGSEVISQLLIKLKEQRKFVHVAAPNCLIPSSKPLELKLLPNAEAIVDEIRRVINE